MFRLLFAVLCALSCPAKDHGYLTAKQIARVREFLPVYEDAARKVGVPALALAALHARESDLDETWKVRDEESVIWRHRNKVPYRNIGGPFMLDCGYDGDRLGFDKAIRAYEHAVAVRFGIDPAPRVRDDFSFACLVAAVELSDKARRPLYDARGHVILSALADAFCRYNGKCCSWRDSAYVVNDPHEGVRLYAERNDDGTKPTHRDKRPGALVIYRELVRRLER